MKWRLLITCCLLTLLPGIARASIGFEFFGDLVTDSSDIGIPDGKALFVIADTTNNGFANPISGNFASGSLWGGSADDLVIWTFAANGTASTGTAGAMDVVSPALILSNFPGWTAGDHLQLVWFPTVNFAGGGSVLANGDAYGHFGFGSTGDDAVNWITPSDGSTADLLFFTPAGSIFGPGNDVPVFGTIAVPEPAMVGVLVSSAALGAAVWRRRRR